MARMTTADMKGDTARGARYLSERQSQQRDRARPALRDYDEELHDYLYKPVDVLKLVGKIPFDEEDVESAAAENPQLYLDAAKLRVQKMRRRTQAKMSYEATAARTRLHTGGTVQAKKDRSILKKEVRQAERDMEAAIRVEEFCKALMSAFKERKDAIRAIIDARWSEAGSAVRSEKKREAREAMSKIQRDIKRRYRETHNQDMESEDDD